MYYTPSWRSGLFRTLRDRNVSVLDNGDVYQFGVFSGNSMVDIAHGYCYMNKTINNFFGYDVFTGMPPEENEELLNDDWAEGTFNIDDHKHKFELESTNVEGIIDEIENRVRAVFDQYNVTITGEVKIFNGLVQDTLNIENLSKYDLRQASYVDVDFDLYYPSKFGLEFLFNQSIIGDNTIVGYDDWGGKPGFDNLSTGESRAHKEVFFDNDIEAQMIVTTLGTGTQNSVNYINKKINKHTYGTINVVKHDNPDWKWGKIIDHVQTAWQINPTNDIYIKNM